MTYFDRRGKRITKLQHKTLSRVDDYTQIASDKVGRFKAYTWWLGESREKLFRTLVMETGREWSEIAPEQFYTSERDALAGHAEVVELLRAIDGAGDERPLTERVHAAVKPLHSITGAKEQTRVNRRWRIG